MALSCIILEIKGYIGQKSWFFHTPCIRRPRLGGSPSDYYLLFWCGKARMMGLPYGEKSLTICLPFLTECRNVTDWQTDRQTDGHRMTAQAALDASIARQKSVIDCLQLSDTKTRDDEKMTPFPKSWYTAFSFSRWILKTWQGENDGYS